MNPVIGSAADPFIDLSKYFNVEAFKAAYLADIFYGIVMATDIGPVIVAFSEDKSHSLFSHRWAVRQTTGRAAQLYERLVEDGIKAGTQEHRNRKAMAYASLIAGHYNGNMSVPIRRLKTGYEPDNIQDANATEPTANYHLFSDVVAYIRGIALFREIGRITLFLNPAGVGTPLHRDGDTPPSPHRQEFIWVNLMNKRFYMQDPNPDTISKRYYVKSDAVMFDHKNWHGSEAGTGATLSLRVDGHFLPEVRAELGLDKLDSYLTPSIYIPKD